MTVAERLDIQASGGCQCGAVRYHAASFLDGSHICHCRMCQKAVGNFFAALVDVAREDLRWTRGEPQSFTVPIRSPAFIAAIAEPRLVMIMSPANLSSVTTGSLDNPALFPPKVQFGTEGRMPWFGTICELQEEGTTEETMADKIDAISSSNHQHPDHDTPDFSGKDA